MEFWDGDAGKCCIVEDSSDIRVLLILDSMASYLLLDIESLDFFLVNYCIVFFVFLSFSMLQQNFIEVHTVHLFLLFSTLCHVQSCIRVTRKARETRE